MKDFGNAYFNLKKFFHKISACDVNLFVDNNNIFVHEGKKMQFLNTVTNLC